MNCTCNTALILASLPFGGDYLQHKGLHEATNISALKIPSPQGRVAELLDTSHQKMIEVMEVAGCFVFFVISPGSAMPVIVNGRFVVLDG